MPSHVFEKLCAFFNRTALIALLTPLLVSCASMTEQVVEAPADWEDRLQRHRQISAWTLKARLGVQTEIEGGSFDVFWQQAAEAYDIRLIAPMGQGAVSINGDGDGVKISLADGQTEYAQDADALFASMTGLSLPVSGLHDWLRGMPIADTAVESISWNENGQLYRLEQKGWRVEMNRYRAVAGFELPHAFYLEREDQPELSVRLLVREWQPEP